MSSDQIFGFAAGAFGRIAAAGREGPLARTSEIMINLSLYIYIYIYIYIYYVALPNIY